MTLYHATTEAKARKYHDTGHICRPVRGFTTPLAAMAWAVRVGRKVIYEIDVEREYCHKLPDHHNDFGEAWWADVDIPLSAMRCFYSAVKP